VNSYIYVSTMQFIDVGNYLPYSKGSKGKWQCEDAINASLNEQENHQIALDQFMKNIVDTTKIEAFWLIAIRQRIVDHFKSVTDKNNNTEVFVKTKKSDQIIEERNNLWKQIYLKDYFQFAQRSVKPNQIYAYVDISNEEYKENVNNMVIYYKFNETDIWSNETSSNMTEFNSTDAGLNLTDGEMHGAGIQVRSLSGLYGLDGNGTAENSDRVTVISLIHTVILCFIIII